MAKDATVGARVDAELKEKANAAFNNMGLPMSLGIELFLRQVAEKGKLPFQLVDEENKPDPEAIRLQHDFWQQFMTWYFEVWPRFDSKEAEAAARERYGYNGSAPGDDIRKLLESADHPTPEMVTAARFDLYQLQSLASDAKELIYWALGMDKVFVPRLSATYSDQIDEWRLQHLKEQARNQAAEDENQLMEYLEDWLLECPADIGTIALIQTALEKSYDYESACDLLTAADLLDDFEEYAAERLEEE